MKYKVTAKKDDALIFEMYVQKIDLLSVINAALENKFELNILPVDYWQDFDFGEDE
jgi:hypothetical protein